MTESANLIRLLQIRATEIYNLAAQGMSASASRKRMLPECGL